MSTVETARTCARCGTALPAEAPEGLCPRCLMALHFATQTDVPGEAGPHGTKVVRPPLLPADIAKYFPQLEILECLGRGGMGVVYKARQPRLDRLVALKILAPEKENDAHFAERFTREAQALARLSHANIVTVHDFGEADGLCYLIMEFVDGANLRQLLQSRHIAPEEALAIVPKICEALQYAHDQGIVHRDIKPENVLVDKQGRVKIADFGIAKIVGANGKPALTEAQVVGTPHYMAPEQIERPTKVDHRADIYSLGVVFYEMLTGELPLGKFQPPSKKVQVDVRLDEVVLHALEKEPERRYQQASEVKTDVETIAAGAEKSKIQNPKSKIGWRGAARASAVLFTILATAVVAGWFTSGRSFSLLACLGAVLVLTTLVTLFGAWIVSALRGEAVIQRLAGVPRADVERNVSASRGEAVIPSAPSPPPISPAATDDIRRQVKGPAIGLLVTGIFNWLVIPLVTLVAAYLFVTPSDSGRDYIMLVPLAALVLSSVMIVAGLKMKRLEAYRLAVTGSILAILVSPGNVIGLPIGIWALVVLMRPEVRAAYGLRAQTRRARHKLALAGATAVMLVIAAGLSIGVYLHRQKTSAATGQRIVAEFDWPRLAGEQRLLGGVPLEVDGRSVLKIENTNDLPLQLSLFTIEQPPITAMRYAVSGEIKYENVEGDGYLEMWSYFPPLAPGLPEGQFFSRTLGAPGSDPMARITGSSSWRSFLLPFDRTGTTNAPTRLEINLFLPGRGVVFLGPIKLREWGKPAAPAVSDSSAAKSSASPQISQTPPVIIHTVPESGASDVDPALAELRVTFSKRMQDAKWSWAKLDDESFPETTGEPRFLDDGRTCVLPVHLKPGKVYAMWLNSESAREFKDGNGQPAVPYLLIFETRK